MFQSYHYLNEFENQYLQNTDLSLEQKFSILDGMVKYALQVKPDIFNDVYSGIQEKVDFVKLFQSVQRANS